MKTECCGYEPPPWVAYPVQWNPLNGVVQCHHCCEVFVPRSAVVKAWKDGQAAAMKWVSEECKRNTERLLEYEKTAAQNPRLPQAG